MANAPTPTGMIPVSLSCSEDDGDDDASVRTDTSMEEPVQHGSTGEGGIHQQPVQQRPSSAGTGSSGDVRRSRSPLAWRDVAKKKPSSEHSGQAAVRPTSSKNPSSEHATSTEVQQQYDRPPIRRSQPVILLPRRALRCVRCGRDNATNLGKSCNHCGALLQDIY